MFVSALSLALVGVGKRSNASSVAAIRSLCTGQDKKPRQRVTKILPRVGKMRMRFGIRTKTGYGGLLAYKAISSSVSIWGSKRSAMILKPHCKPHRALT